MYIIYIGEIASVEGTVVDLQKPTLVNTILDKGLSDDGLHGAVILNGEKGNRKLVAK